MIRPALKVADIFRECGAQYRKIYGPSMSREQYRAMRAIEVCRTAFLGGHIDQCDCCGKERNSYNSCRNRMFLSATTINWNSCCSAKRSNSPLLKPRH